MQFNRLSIRLALWMLVASALLQLAHGLYRYSTDIPQAEQNARLAIDRVVHSIQPALSESLYQYNENLAQQILKTFQTYPSVLDVKLVDDESQPFGSWSRLQSDTGSMPSLDEVEQISWPITYEEQTVGYLLMDVQWDSAKLAAQQAVWDIIGFSILMGMMAMGILYWIAQVMVANPIAKMSQFLSQLNPRQLSEQDIQPLSEIASQAELYNLKQSLHEILNQLHRHLADKQKTMELLQGYNENLEYEVTKRTSELEIAKNKAESANQSKTDFLNTMTHELRTPLNSIIGFSSILAGQELPERLLKLSKNIHNSGQQLLELINDIIDYISLESNPLQVQVFSVFDVIQSVNQEVQAAAKAKGLQYSSIENSETIMKGDPKRLSMVLRHLLNNAIKFTQTGSVWFSIDLIDQANIVFVVRDSGVGMDMDNIEFLTNAFNQHEQGLDRTSEGVGLGLAIVNRVCQKWQGQLTFVSPEGGGTEVRLTLPLEMSEQSALP